MALVVKPVPFFYFFNINFTYLVCLFHSSWYICTVKTAYSMRKSTIWLLGGVMGISFLILLYLQTGYMRDMVSMRNGQMEESIKRALYQVAHTLEIEEARKYLENDMEAVRQAEENARQNIVEQTFTFPDGSSVSVHHSIPGGAPQMPSYNQMPSLQMPRPGGNPTVSERNRSLQEDLLKRYINQRAMMDEVIYSMIFTASNRPLRDRIDFSLLANELTAQLQNNGLNIPFHYIVTTNSGRVVGGCECEDFDPKNQKYSFSQALFSNDPPSRMGVLRVYFPTYRDSVMSSVRFMIPSIIFTIVLLITFILTLVLVFRQKKLSEAKNDFINNMTHEFKTPISTISLAAQMLGDPSVTKSPQMFQHISGVIGDETKRLRFQVEKVLQMSMFERKVNNLKLKETDANELISGVVKTFRLKVESCGGDIDTKFEAFNPFIMADEMHFTNVIFNLMDNAVKYRRQDASLHLEVRTWNEYERMWISISDNGIGISKEDLKKIFEKFYRVHTGNLHDVKGFGLGLAYVRRVVQDHGGVIKAESELGSGTRFIITLPSVKE